MEFLELEWRRCIRTGGTVSLIMIEIDSFKQLIDHHGRQAGDECLKKAAGVLSYSANGFLDEAKKGGGNQVRPFI